MILFGFLESFCWISLATWVEVPFQGLLILVAVQVAVAFCNVIGEALLVEVSRDVGSENKENDSSEASK